MEEFQSFSRRTLSIQDYVRMLVKRRWAIAAVFIIVFGTVAFYTFTEVPIYKATAQILIERPTPRILDQGSASFDYLVGEEFYQTQYKLLESRALAKKLADKLQLKNHPNYVAIFKNLPPDADEVQKERPEEALVGSIAGGVSVSPIRQSSLVNLSFSHPDPKFAAYIVNNLAQCYIEQSLDLRFAASQEAAAWLKGKSAEARKTLEESEAKLNEYKREQNIVTQEDKESITAQKLEQLNRELVTAQTHRMEVETRFKEVSAGRPISQVLNNGLIQALKGTEAKLMAEQSELARKFGPDHPRMIQLDNELASIRAKIGTEMSQVIQTIKNEYTMAKAQEDNLKAALTATKADTQDLSDRAIQYRVLLRDVETNRALYENVLKSLKTITTTENVPATNIRIVYPATVPQAPVSPRTSRNLYVGSSLGLFFGLLLALGLEGMDTTLKTPEEVEKWLEAPTLAMIPHLDLKDKSELVVHHGTEPLASESYRGLRTSILFSSPGKAPRIILVTSSLPAEGKTLNAVNLATVMAKAEGRVLLVDSDLRHPDLHKIFQVPREPGLTNFLVGEIDSLPFLETEVPNLFVLPSGPISPNPSELLGSERMQEFLTRAREEFARTILDSPPLVSVTDAAIISARVDGVLLIVKAETVPRKAALEAKGQMEELNANILGAILNDVPPNRNIYYHYYYHRYRSYYHSKETTSARGRRCVPKSIMASRWLKDRLASIRLFFYQK
jgi:capsular exopolysaccharide synthesis family protein